VQEVRPQVVDAAHRQQHLEEVWPAEEGVGRVEGAEAGPRGANARRAVAQHAANVRDDLVLDVLGEEHLAARLLVYGQAAVEPGVVVDAADAEDLHAAREEVVGHRLDEAHALGLEEVSARGGEEQQRWAPVAVADDGHVHAQAVAVPAEEFAAQIRIDV
jgi:hypothetical protein